MAPKAKHGKSKATKPTSAPAEDVALTWPNFQEVKRHFDLSDEEAVAALTEIIGPPGEDTLVASRSPCFHSLASWLERVTQYLKFTIETGKGVSSTQCIFGPCLLPDMSAPN